MSESKGDWFTNLIRALIGTTDIKDIQNWKQVAALALNTALRMFLYFQITNYLQTIVAGGGLKLG